jgi:hypothetical protein
MLSHVAWNKFTDVSDVLTASIIGVNSLFTLMIEAVMMMEEVSTSETSVNLFEIKWRNIPEDSHIHIRRLENLKYQCYNVFGDSVLRVCDFTKSGNNLTYCF